LERNLKKERPARRLPFSGLFKEGELVGDEDGPRCIARTTQKKPPQKLLTRSRFRLQRAFQNPAGRGPLPKGAPGQGSRPGLFDRGMGVQVKGRADNGHESINPPRPGARGALFGPPNKRPSLAMQVVDQIRSPPPASQATFDGRHRPAEPWCGGAVGGQLGTRNLREPLRGFSHFRPAGVDHAGRLFDADQLDAAIGAVVQGGHTTAGSGGLEAEVTLHEASGMKFQAMIGYFHFGPGRWPSFSSLMSSPPTSAEGQPLQGANNPRNLVPDYQGAQKPDRLEFGGA